MDTNLTETSNAVGRPSTYSPEVADSICRQLMEGVSLKYICSADDMPAMSTVFLWIQKHAEFSDKYTRAREIQAEVMADELNDIADDGSNDWMDRELKNGETIRVPDHEHINRSRLRVDTRKWIAARLLPKKYGDKVSAEVSGKDGGPITFTLRRVGAQGE